MGCMGGSSAPPAPDYTGAAEKQAQSSKEISTATNWANRPDINTPFGSQSWEASAGTDPATGQAITKWKQNINLTPAEQESLEAQRRIQSGRSAGAETLLGQAVGNFQKEFNWGGMPARADAPGQTTQSTNEPAFAQQRNQIEQALFDKMRPEHAMQQDAARTRLANSGLAAGSEAYNRELARIEGNQAGERWNAMNAAGQEQSRMQQGLLSQQQQAFGQNFSSAGFQNQNRQQAIAEEAQRRGMTLNELNALLTGTQVQMPGGMQGAPNSTAQGSQATNYLNAAQMQGQYNTQNKEEGMDWGSAIGGIASVAGVVL